MNLRRSKIKKLIRQQKKGAKPLFLIYLDLLPVMDENNCIEALKLLNTRGVILSEWKPEIIVTNPLKRRIL